jgi:hypothetical protein
MSKHRPAIAIEGLPLPQWLLDVVETLPKNIDRRRGAEVITQHLFRVSHRSLEVWPVAVRFVNGRNQMNTRELLQVAWARLNAAPKVMRGRRRAEHAVDQISP